MKYEELWHPLSAIYGAGEAKAIARYLLEIRYDLSMTDILCGGVEKLPEEELKGLLDRLLHYEPVQYVVNEAVFGGRRFHVTPDVLIPRPETYELCEWIIKEKSGTKEERRILDIGTGSGCIAVTLAAEIPHAKVTAWDISDQALRIAEENAKRAGVHVSFEKRNALSSLLSPSIPELSSPTRSHSSFLPTPYSLIVSNPPYICPHEKEGMEKNVLDYEPHLALFVPEEDPLVFYRAIATGAKRLLAPNGALYFEINPVYVNDLDDMLSHLGFQQVTVRSDQFGKERFIKATLNP